MATVDWRLNLASPPERVFDALCTDAGRASFWAKSAARRDGQIHCVFPGGHAYRGPVLAVRRLRCRPAQP